MPQAKKPQAGKAQQRNKNEAMTLQDLFLMKLSVLHDIETQLVRALPAVARRAGDPELRQAVENHLEQTKEHVARIDRAFGILGTSKKSGMESEGMRGIIADAEWVIGNIAGPAIDAALIASARAAEHHEMVTYRSAIEWARLLEQDDIADLLTENFEEEEEADEILEELASSKVNETSMGNENEEGKEGEGESEGEEDTEDDTEDDDDDEEQEET